MPRIAVVHAFRRAGGGLRRVQQWMEAATLSGFDVIECPILDPGLPPVGAHHLGAIARGHTAPETLVWSGRHLRQRLAEARVDGVIAVSLRAFDPGVADHMPLLLDYVDILSASYMQRARVTRQPPKSLGWRLLASAIRRTESFAKTVPGVTCVAAGRRDSEILDVEWVPLTVPNGSIPTADAIIEGAHAPERALFLGTLDYPPNVVALESLASQVWPIVHRLAPSATLLVAGRRPTSRAIHAVKAMGAALLPDFGSLDDLRGMARVALAPLEFTAGMQSKVLDGVVLGLPQVVTTHALDGFGDDFPAHIEPLGPSFAHSIVELLQDRNVAIALAQDAALHAAKYYTQESRRDVMTNLLVRAFVRGRSV